MSNIHQLGGSQGQLPQKPIAGEKASGKTAGKPDPSATPPETQDRAELSSSGFQSLLAKARAALAETPEVRADVVERVRQRIASGYYQQPEVLEELAGKLGQAFRAE